MWRGGVRLGIYVTGHFGCRCLTSLAMAPFPHPTINPGGPFAGTRRSDKALRHLLLHTFAHKQSPLGSLEPV
jgi:hypothetical protein